MADPFGSKPPERSSFGGRGVMITPDDDADFATVFKAVEVTSIAGGTTLRVLPVGNADGAWIDYVGVAVGFRPSFRVRRVGETTNCSVVGVTD